MRTKIFNLIILDESGSMECVRKQTINGCNETINTVISAQRRFAETQEHFTSIFAFQENSEVKSHYLIKNEPAEEVKHITMNDYNPWGSTPLYDALGATLVDLKQKVDKEELAIGSVTIITDGEENSSKVYTLERVSEMIEALKEKGWNFNFIGANIDVKQTAHHLNIDNYLEFEQSEEEVDEMFARERKSRMNYYRRMSDASEEAAALGEALLAVDLKELSKNYFDLPEEDEKE